MSTGESSLADKVAEDGRGRRLAAGQEVRVVDVPADAGAGLGLFEALHDFTSAEALARHLRTESTSTYGTAARQFLLEIVGDLDAVRQAVGGHVTSFIETYLAPGADGQVHRVAQRFGLIAAAGELAATAGVLPWPEGEATAAAARVYQAWLDVRGGVEPAEVRNGVEQVRSFILAHGMSRFIPAWEETSEPKVSPRDVAGYRKRSGEGWDYYITTSAWREHVCRGLDSRAVAATLAERGHLIIPRAGSRRSVESTTSRRVAAGLPMCQFAGNSGSDANSMTIGRFTPHR